MICTVIFCLVFTAPAKWRIELRAKIGQYRNRCFVRQSEFVLIIIENCIYIKVFNENFHLKHLLMQLMRLPYMLLPHIS